MEFEVLHETNEAYQALDNLESGLPTSWNGVGWDGDSENSYGRDCVYSAIWQTIRDNEELLEQMGFYN